ncbi:hypothetical protein AAMO2058_001013200 [Amorphochlora amoebiformis]
MGSRSRLSVSRSRRPEALSWFQKQFSATDLWRMPAFTKASDSRQLMLTKPKYGPDSKQWFRCKPLKEMQVGDEMVELFQDDIFSTLREAYQLKDDFIGGENFSFDWMKEGGGKGGSLMAFDKKRHFIVKELSGGDHATLLKIAVPLTKHCLNKHSLLARYFAHFRRKKNGMVYVVMNSVLPHIKGLSWTYLFDLKGNRDDKLIISKGEAVPAVHNRVWNCLTCWYGCNGSCEVCTTEDRQLYFSGKLFSFTCTLSVAKSQREQIMSAMNADVLCLRDQLQTMDYSLLLAVLSIPYTKMKKGISSEESLAISNAPYVCVTGKGSNKKVVAYYMGIIDYLQEWTCTKSIARCIKLCAPRPKSTVPPTIYAHQFLSAFGRKFVEEGKPFKIAKPSEVTQEDKKALDEFISLVDKKRNGSIHIKDAMQNLPAILRPELFLKNLDIDNDQKVSSSEILDWFKGMKQREPKPVGFICQLLRKEITPLQFKALVHKLDEKLSTSFMGEDRPESGKAGGEEEKVPLTLQPGPSQT